MSTTDSWISDSGLPTIQSTMSTNATASSTRTNRAVMNGLQVAIGSLGIVSNSVVLLVYLTFKELRKRRTMLYIVNQSIVDFLNGVFLILVIALPYDGRVFTSPLDTLYCHLWLAKFPLFASFNLSTYNLVILTLERYFSVVYPIRHKTFCTRVKIMISIAICWILAVVMQLSLTSPGVKVIDGACLLYAWEPETQRGKAIFGAFINYLIPIFLFIFCYARMFKALNVKVAPAGSETTNSASTESNLRARGKRNVIRTMTIVATVYILCSSWNQIWYMLYSMGLMPKNSNRSTYRDFSIIALFSNCFVNPFIYAARYEEFQKGLKNIGVQLKKKLLRDD